MARIDSIAEFLLNTFSDRQLQSGVDFIIPFRQDLPTTIDIHKYSRPYVIKARKRHIAGTGIPASVFTRARRGDIRLSQRTYAKLERLYRRWSYNRLRAYGMSRGEARKYHRQLPQQVLQRSNLYFKYIQAIADAKKVDPFFVLYGFRISNKQFEDWQHIISGGVDLGEIYASSYSDFPDPDAIKDETAPFRPPKKSPPQLPKYITTKKRRPSRGKKKPKKR
jgi:hypothetical protein